MGSEQRWLTVDEICTTLRLGRDTVLRLRKDGFLVSISGGNKGGKPSVRILDPTPEYKEKLRLAAILLHKEIPESSGLREKALFTRRELDLIVGWTFRAGTAYLKRNMISGVRLKSNYVLYTGETVRKILWHRSGRKLADGRSPVVLTELIEWFKQWESKQRSLIPSDEQFLQDDRIQQKLGFIARMSDSDRRKAEADFTRKVELAKRVVQILDLHGDGKCNSDEHSRANASR